MVALYALAFYVAIGLIVAVAFVSRGAQQITHSSLTVGARILLLPAATVLWPYVLGRWLKASRQP
jgi:hypothetical protein